MIHTVTRELSVTVRFRAASKAKVRLQIRIDWVFLKKF
jgi:hypothetical protein